MKPFLLRSFAGAGIVAIVRAMSLVVMLAVGATFVLSALLIRSAMSGAVVRQAQIEQARLARARLLALQLDEEAGIRGFAATGDPAFLQPYRAALGHWRSAVDDLRNRLAATDPSSVSLAAAEDRENALWLRAIAGPIVRNPDVRRSVALHLYGKNIVDAFRALDDEISAVLERAAVASDAAAQRLVDDIVLWAVVLGALAVLAVIVFTTFLVRILDEMRANLRAYEEEKRIADMLQEAFVQQTLPDIGTISLDAVYVPAGREAHVGGDWYDAFELPDKRVLFSIGDVCGHGVKAAIVMSRARQAILSASLSDRDPARVLALVNDVLALQDSTMVTAVCGFIEPGTMKISYATAGHPPPILAGADGVARALPIFGPPLAVVEAPSYRTLEMQASADAMLMLYTDGLTEYARNVVEGEERLLRVCGEAAAGRVANPAQFIYEKIFDDESPVDDVALLVAAFTPGVRLWRSSGAAAE
jgi:CHASE3 domain sensor protein